MVAAFWQLPLQMDRASHTHLLSPSPQNPLPQSTLSSLHTTVDNLCLLTPFGPALLHLPLLSPNCCCYNHLPLQPSPPFHHWLPLSHSLLSTCFAHTGISAHVLPCSFSPDLLPVRLPSSHSPTLSFTSSSLLSPFFSSHPVKHLLSVCHSPLYQLGHLKENSLLLLLAAKGAPLAELIEPHVEGYWVQIPFLPKILSLLTFNVLFTASLNCPDVLCIVCF